MAGDKPNRKQFPVVLGKILDESSTPRLVGDNGGAIAMQNVIYRRAGAWGQRPGLTTRYLGEGGGTPGLPMTGVRWYRTAPSLLTALVVSDGNSGLWSAGDPGNFISPTGFGQIRLFTTTASHGQFPVSFASAYDPTTQSDILIMCGSQMGAQQHGPGFANLFVNFGFAVGDVYTITIVNSTTTTATYTVTEADNNLTISQGLAAALNASAAAFSGTDPTVGQAVAVVNPEGTFPELIYVPALNVGISATATIKITTSGAGNPSPNTPVVLNPAGNRPQVGPWKWTGSGAIVPVSGAIGDQQAVTPAGNQVTFGTAGQPQACVSWHNHVWYWGCQNQPNALFASDINQPQNASFMMQNGPYIVGLGDGDAGIKACVPIGNILYVFKTHSIYAITGYDFQPGEYAFNIQPAIQNQGIPSSGCVSTLRDALVFWTGTTFRRLSPGALETEDIGIPIALTQGDFSGLDSALFIQSVGGSFNAETTLYADGGNTTLNNCAYFIMDINGTDTDQNSTRMLVYDDDASQYNGAYAWSEWDVPQNIAGDVIPPSDQTIYGLVTFGGGLNTALTQQEPNQLYYLGSSIDGTGNFFASQMGEQTNGDNGVQIPASVTTGWITCGTPALSKELHQVYLEVNANLGLPITMIIFPSVYTEQSGSPAGYAPVEVQFAATRNTISVPGFGVFNDQYQVLQATIKPFLRANAFMFSFQYGSAQSGDPDTQYPQCEIVAITLDYVEEAFLP